MPALRRGILALAMGLIALGVIRADGAFFAMALPLAAWVLLGVWLGAPRIELEAERHLAKPFLAAGGAVEMHLLIRNRGPRIECLELHDESLPGAMAGEGTTCWRGSLDPDGEIELRYQLRPRRGVYAFATVEALAESPFTGTRARASLPCPATLTVYPQPLLPSKASFGSGAGRPFPALGTVLRQGNGTTFVGTRDYTPGDSLRRINWRAQALWNQEIVNVFSEERAIDAGIILDCRAEAYTDTALFEEAVSAAASLAESLMGGGNRVAFLCYGDAIRWTPSGTGRERVFRLRKAAAQAALGSHPAFEQFDRLPISLFPARSRIIIVSPLLHDDVQPLRSLVAAGYGVTVLKPGDPGSMAAEDADEAGRLARGIVAFEDEILLSRILQSGIEVLGWDIARPLGSAKRYAGWLR